MRTSSQTTCDWWFAEREKSKAAGIIEVLMELDQVTFPKAAPVLCLSNSVKVKHRQVYWGSL